MGGRGRAGGEDDSDGAGRRFNRIDAGGDGVVGIADDVSGAVDAGSDCVGVADGQVLVQIDDAGGATSPGEGMANGPEAIRRADPTVARLGGGAESVDAAEAVTGGVEVDNTGGVAGPEKGVLGEADGNVAPTALLETVGGKGAGGIESSGVKIDGAGGGAGPADGMAGHLPVGLTGAGEAGLGLEADLFAALDGSRIRVGKEWIAWVEVDGRGSTVPEGGVGRSDEVAEVLGLTDLLAIVHPVAVTERIAAEGAEIHKRGGGTEPEQRPNAGGVAPTVTALLAAIVGDGSGLRIPEAEGIQIDAGKGIAGEEISVALEGGVIPATAGLFATRRGIEFTDGGGGWGEVVEVEGLLREDAGGSEGQETDGSRQ